jgi:hypothetical protein
MRTGVSIAGLFILVLLATAGCTKHSSTVSGGGKGGAATLVITPEHHGQFVDTCTIYIKYGTLDAPANGVYDDSTTCIIRDTTPVAVFPGLTAGEYYIFGIGYHATYTPPNVKGGVPVTIQTADTNTLYLPTYTYYP